MISRKCAKCRENEALFDAPTCPKCNEDMDYLCDMAPSLHFAFKCTKCDIFSPLHYAVCDECWPKTPKASWSSQHFQEPVEMSGVKGEK